MELKIDGFMELNHDEMMQTEGGKTWFGKAFSWVSKNAKTIVQVGQALYNIYKLIW